MMNAHATSGKEIEIKLDLGSFTNYLKLLGFLGQIEREEQHYNAFFDTADRALGKKGWSLRVRVESDCGRITLKGAKSRQEGASVRDEIESEISRTLANEIINAKADVMELEHEPIVRARNIIGKKAVETVVQFENVRKKKAMRLEDYEYIFEVDMTEFPDGSVDYELELELPDVSRIEWVSQRLERIMSSLDIPFEHQPESKFARALKRSGRL